jgi:hypothetical protein
MRAWSKASPRNAHKDNATVAPAQAFGKKIQNKLLVTITKFYIATFGCLIH